MQSILITGAETITGYNTARSIYDPCLNIYGLISKQNAWPVKSGIWKKLFAAEQDKESIVDELLTIGKDLFEQNHKKTILLPSQDYIVELIAHNSEKLKIYYDFIQPELKVVERLLDKTVFHKWALSEGFLLPQSAIVTSSTELKTSLARFSYPVIIKPLFRSEKWDILNDNEKCLFLYSEKDIEDYPHDLFEISDRYIIQEWIDGGDDDVYFCLMYINRNSEIKGVFSGRKLLQWPLDNGSTSICISHHDQRIIDISCDLLVSSGMIGLGSLEFKYNKKTDRFYIIEPTVGRNDHQSYVATAAGINLTMMAVRDLICHKSTSPGKNCKSIWIDEVAAIRGIAKSRNYKLLTQTFKHLVFNNKSFAIFSCTDMRPFSEVIKYFGTKLIKKTRKKSF